VDHNIGSNIVGTILAIDLVYSHVYMNKKCDIILNIISENDENHGKIEQIFIAITNKYCRKR